MNKYNMSSYTVMQILIFFNVYAEYAHDT